uniref:ethanolamine kinase n=1 Tax=Panagrellus redivivus TaxID=6233 RepID=A0A7E4ZVU2_PANRE
MAWLRIHQKAAPMNAFLVSFMSSKGVAKPDLKPLPAIKLCSQGKHEGCSLLSSGANMTLESLPVKTYDVEIDISDDALIKKQTLAILKDLRPQWQADSIKFKTFTQGITNRIFRVTHQNYPEDKLIFRVFGKNTNKVIDRLCELETIAKMSEAGLAAPLHAKFSNGIVCGYLEGDTLDSASVREPQITEKICEAMARMHQIPVEPTEGPFIFNKMRQYLDNLPQSFPLDSQTALFNRYFGNNDLQEQFVHLKKLLTALETPVVFCHNDLLVYNILYDNAKDEVHFIDYEYAAPNYQLFDIANHFCEYAGVEEPDYSLCPTNDQKRAFLKSYLTYFLKREPQKTEVDASFAMIPFFEAASHFFWCLWALIQAANSTLDFDYLKYAIVRHQMFVKVINIISSA